MSKQTVTNTWSDGLNKDLNPIITPNTVLTDNLNGTFITYNGNEFSLQNDMGNVYTTKLSDGFYPIGMAEYGGIVYIASIKKSYKRYLKADVAYNNKLSDVVNQIVINVNSLDQSLNFKEEDARAILNDNIGLEASNQHFEDIVLQALNSSNVTNIEAYDKEASTFELGSFPSLSPSALNISGISNSTDFYSTDEIDFEYKYRPLQNLIKVENGTETIAPFRTDNLSNYDLQHPVSIDVQSSYDGSVNLILSDNLNPPRLINSGFAVLENGKGRFVKRNQNNKTNYYNEEFVEQLTKLINSTTHLPIIDLGSDNNDGVTSGGQLKCGNYTFYFRFADEDGNKTDIIAESGIVSIFKGTVCKPNTISGGLYNELTDKMVTLTINGVDTSYSKIYVSYVREFCDLNGYRLTEAYNIVEPFTITSFKQSITISGLENIESISIEDLNIKYFNINSNKATTQQQNMLFLGNVDINEPDSSDLQKLSYEIIVQTKLGDDIGDVNPINYNTNPTNPDTERNKYDAEYYNPRNIYYRLGYWPDELYRFGVVYIKADGSTTSAYNLKGCIFNSTKETNMSNGHIPGYTSNDGIFVTGTDDKKGDNIVGVFKTPDNIEMLTTSKALCFNFEIPETTCEKLRNIGVIGYFIVRQKRIPITLCQGFGVGINKDSFIPTIKYNNQGYYAESFITKESESLEYNPITSDTSGTTVYENSKNVGFYFNISDQYVIDELVTFIVIPIVTRDHTEYTVKIIGPNKDENDKVIRGEEDVVYKTVTAYDRQRAIDLAIDYCNENNYKLIDNYIQSTNSYNRNNLKQEQQRLQNDVRDRFLTEKELQKNSFGLLSVEASVNPTIQSMLNGSEFEIRTRVGAAMRKDNQIFTASPIYPSHSNSKTAKLVYLPSGTQLKYVDKYGFSNVVGDGINVDQFGFLKNRENSEYKKNPDVVRGTFTPYIGGISENSNNFIGYVSDIRVPHDSTYKNDIIARANDMSEYYAVSNKMSIYYPMDVYRGDCYKNTVSIRMHRNFVDPVAPIADKIVKKDCWKNNYYGYANIKGKDEETSTKTDWTEINLTDLNTVSLGHWVTFKCLANTNLGLRSEDTSNTSEMALLGNARSFYPLTAASTVTAMKVQDSTLLNDGYSATVGRKRYTIKPKTPYDKNEFSNRIMFSNISITDSFTNGYRVFQGLSYQDYTKQYGAIIKLLPWGNNIFCVFEHGIAIVPINEKALMQTTTDQSIHIYGHGVLPDQLSVISQDYGSIWADSVIRTPIGIYGVDTTAKKIWRFSDSNGFETLSDMKIQRFLNDNINLGLTRQENLGITNVKTHFNNYKGDVMFTFYHTSYDETNQPVKKEWNMCYNERQGLWVTRYDWIPIFSANVDNVFYSIPLELYSDNNDFSIWKHGRTGIDSFGFRPTLWYGKQYSFEFEFAIKDPVGLHKIFENLVITSNNVQPKELEFQIIGDAYMFNKARIYHDAKNIYGNYGEDRPYKMDWNGFTKDDFSISNFKPMFYNARVEYDPVLDEYSMIISQQCKNKETYGVRLGNIQYKEDGWYTNIEPLRYNVKLNQQSATEFSESDPFASAKIRDKWLKVRIKYAGDKLAIISGVTTFENMSYA